MPSIDIIVPCYRYAHFLRECVTSVLAEHELQVRVIILDDASPDNTPEVASQLSAGDARVTYRRHTVNQRHIATYNEGIEWVAADYLLLLSADDYLLPGALRRAVDFLEANPRVGFVYGRAILTPDSGVKGPPPGTAATTGSWKIKTGVEFMNEVAQRGTINPVPTPTAIVRTRLQKQVGGYRPELPHTGDMEMWLRLAAYADVGEFDGFLAIWRRHESNMQFEYYRSDYGIADLSQRRAAIDWFSEYCKPALADAVGVRKRLLSPLAQDALKHASGAFNDGRVEVVAQLEEFALSADPGVKQTHRWRLLTLKRAFGMRLWRALYAPAARLLGRA
jgi:glycosyltransferase involved in cell wall biosynthesis